MLTGWSGVLVSLDNLKVVKGAFTTLDNSSPVKSPSVNLDVHLSILNIMLHQECWALIQAFLHMFKSNLFVSYSLAVVQPIVIHTIYMCSKMGVHSRETSQLSLCIEFTHITGMPWRLLCVTTCVISSIQLSQDSKHSFFALFSV